MIISTVNMIFLVRIFEKYFFPSLNEKTLSKLVFVAPVVIMF